MEIDNIYNMDCLEGMKQIPDGTGDGVSQGQRVMRCGDNGIFKGVPPTFEQQLLTDVAAAMYDKYGTDGKYLIRACHGMERTKKCRGNYNLTICQSNEESPAKLHALVQSVWDKKWPFAKVHNNLIEPGPLFGFDAINPLGPWTGGINVDCGCTNRKLGSDMGDGVTGGGLMGKDLSKADVSVNIVCYLKAVASGQVVTAICSIGDECVTFVYHAPSAALGDAQVSLAPHSLARGCTSPDGYTETERFADIVEQARLYILTDCGGSFETFACWGLIRPNEAKGFAEGCE